MRNLKRTILALSIVALLAAPLLSYGQATGEVTKADLQAMTSTSNELAKYAQGSAEHNNRLPAALQQCAKIGETLRTITNGTHSTLWLPQSNKCAPGRVDNSIKGMDYLSRNIPGSRNYSVMNVDAGYQTYLAGVESGNAAPLNQPKVKEANKLSADAAASNVNPFSQFLNWIIEGLGSIVASILAGIATLGLWLLGWVLDQTVAAKTPAIVERGWIIVRDFMNLFFIVALIAMAIATILRLESYNYKRLLFRLVTMALLINFSKVIAETLIGFSDTLIAVFSPRGGILDHATLLFQSFVTGGDGWAGAFGQGRGITEGIGMTVTKVIALGILAVTFIAVALLMFVRIIGLWFLVMVSPVAYALNILPYTQQYAKQWWQTFFKYLIWGPVAMFFFRISFTMIRENGNNFVANSALNSLFISAFVWAGFMAARSSGMVGAGAIIKGADSALNRMKGLGISGVRAGGNYFWRGTAAGHGAYLAGALLAPPGDAAKWRDATKDRVGRATAWVSNKPKQIKEGWVDKPNKDRKELIEKQQRKMMLKKNYLGDFDKDSAGKISSEDIDYLAKRGMLNEAKIRNIMESGNAKAKKRILYHLKKGNIASGKGGLDDTSYNDVLDVVSTSVWKEKGGREYEKHPDFMKMKDKDGKTVLNPAHIEIKATRTIKVEKGETLEKIEKDEPKSIKADVPVSLVREMGAEMRKKAEDKEKTDTAKPLIIPSTSPEHEKTESSADRMKAIKDAAGDALKKK